MVKLDRCAGGCNTMKVSFPSNTEHLTLNVFNMITGINELKTLTKYI